MLPDNKNVIIYNSDNCPICLNKLKSPVVAPCGHAFCIECLLNHIKFNSYQTVSCPMCRNSIEDIMKCWFQNLNLDLIKESEEKTKLWKLIIQVSSKQKQKDLQLWKKLLATTVLIAIAFYFIFS